MMNTLMLYSIINIKINIFQMHYDPKCSSNKHKCQQICVSAACRVNNPFVCVACNNLHKEQACQIMPYKKLVRQFHKVQGIYTNQLLKYEERVQNTFSELMGGLRKQFVKFREEFQYININDKIQKIYEKIKNNKQNDLTGQMVYWALNSKKKVGIQYKVKDELQMRMLKQNICQIYGQVINRLPPYYSLRQLEQVETETGLKNNLKQIEDKYVNKRNLTSGIMGQHFNYLQEIMKKQIYNIQLLYRATENNFSAEIFHQKCNGIPNTVMIAKTQFNNIVIGYCPFPWQSPNQWVYKQDTKDQCFLISPSKELKGKKFTPLKTKFAIGMHKDYGPSFGDDFVIYDKAHHSKNCWSNFPDVYTHKLKPIQHTNQTIKSFVGVKDHFEKFNLKQWQVYKLSFGAGQELQSSWIRQYKGIKYN